MNTSPLAAMSEAGRLHIFRPANFDYLEWVVGPPTPFYNSRHVHEELEIAHNIGRTWRHIVRGQSAVIGADALVLTPPGEPHQADSPEIGTAPYLGLRVDYAVLSADVAALRESRAPMPELRNMVNDDPALRTVFLDLHRVLYSPSATRLVQDALWQRFVAILHRLSAASGTLPPVRHEPDAIRLVKAYMNDHIQENTSLETLAALVQLSPFALVRSFSAAVGIPPHAYQTQIRIQQAQRLLRAGQAPGDVAWLTGFASQSHLGVHFKRLVGMTPGQYIADCRLCKNVIESPAASAVLSQKGNMSSVDGSSQRKGIGGDFANNRTSISAR